MPKTIAILQSNYLPWRGYFDIIGLCDEFVFYDSAQYTRNDWRNRNRIKTAQGPRWLTVPVITAGRFGQAIADAEIEPSNWVDRHWKSIEQAYARAPWFRASRPRFEAAFEVCRALRRLSAVNRVLTEAVMAELGIETRLRDVSEFSPAGDRNQRLVAICQAASAQTYLSGPSARAYLDLPRFEAAGIEVRFMEYAAYEPYPQLHGPFEGAVTVLDLLFNTGPGASAHLQYGRARGTVR